MMMSKTLDTMRYGYRKMRPTKAHRPILTFGILGTVYGISPQGEVRYFDYNWDAALKFAGVSATTLEQWKALDLRLGKPRFDLYLPGYDMWHPERVIRTRHRAYWVLKEK